MTASRSFASSPARPSPSPASAPAFRVLSVRQPWAGLIVHGYKAIENRDWSTSHRGLVAIHASTNDATRDYREFIFGDHVPGQVPPIRPKSTTPRKLREACELLSGPEGPTPSQLSPRGAIIGVVEIVDVVNVLTPAAGRKLPSSMPGFRVDPRIWYHPQADFAWLLANPVPLAKPIPCHGKLNLWHLPAREAALLHAALGG